MKNQMDLKTDCNTCRKQLDDLLLDASYASKHPDVAAHIADCRECRAELEELRATIALLDIWVAPEPSPYFDAKLHARLREIQASAPEGLWDRMRSFLVFSTTGHRLRPAMAVALACVLVLGGGGTLAGIYLHSTSAIQASPTVNDLKILDNNAQAFQQMDQLLDPNANSAPST